MASVARALVPFSLLRPRLGLLSCGASALLPKRVPRMAERLPRAPLARTRMESRAHSARRDGAQLAWLGTGQALATAQRARRSGHGAAARRAEGKPATNGSATGRAHANARPAAGSPGPAATRDARQGIPGAAGPAGTRRPGLPARSAGSSQRWADGRPEPGTGTRQGPRQQGRTWSQIASPKSQRSISPEPARAPAPP